MTDRVVGPEHGICDDGEAIRPSDCLPLHATVGQHLAVSGDPPRDEDAALLRHAVRNNAEWCDVMCRAHGGSGRFQGGWWSSPRRTPPLHPDAVTLQPEAVEAQVLHDIDTTAGCSIKDSFSNLDLRAAGFHVLFDAEWVVRAAESVAPRRREATAVVGDRRRLRARRMGVGVE